MDKVTIYIMKRICLLLLADITSVRVVNRRWHPRTLAICIVNKAVQFSAKNPSPSKIFAHKMTENPRQRHMGIFLMYLVLQDRAPIATRRVVNIYKERKVNLPFVFYSSCN